jgi:hypothetical protein
MKHLSGNGIARGHDPRPPAWAPHGRQRGPGQQHRPQQHGRDTISLAPPAHNNPDLRTTGILVGSSTHIAVVISGNHIHHDIYIDYIDGLVRATFGGNHHRRVHTAVKFT